MKRNLVRVAIVVWAAFAIAYGFASWTDTQGFITRPVGVSDGPLATVNTAVTCAAPMKRATVTMPVELANQDIVRPRPCAGRDGRRVLFGIDVVAAIAAMALTFVRPTWRWRRNGAADAVSVNQALST